MGGISARDDDENEESMSRDLQSLVQPISAEAPCGADLEDSQLLASFEALRLFGSATPLAAETDWRAVREKSLEALAQSHDLRLLAYLSAAILRLEGLAAFCAALGVAERWLTERWDQVHPRVEEDALLRKNALSCLADRMAVVDGVRRAQILSHRQLGSFSLRDVELASGQLEPVEEDTSPPTSGQIEATLAASPLEEISALARRLAAGTTALRRIVAMMQERGGFEAAPDFDPLLKPLMRIEKLLADHVAGREPGEAGAAAVTDQPDGESTGPGGNPGQIRSRQDAIRAIDTISAYFRAQEPSSPVPLLLERAKRLVSKSFLEALEDIAPDGLSQARLIGGVRDEE
jgi:type VI secretion system protein ImpA